MIPVLFLLFCAAVVFLYWRQRSAERKLTEADFPDLDTTLFPKWKSANLKSINFVIAMMAASAVLMLWPFVPASWGLDKTLKSNGWSVSVIILFLNLGVIVGLCFATAFYNLKERKLRRIMEGKSGTKKRPESPTERAAREKIQRQKYLNTTIGKAELYEAFMDIHAEAREKRVAGAKKLAELKSGKAFSPLLKVLQKEQDQEVRILLLQAIKETVSALPFDPLFGNAIEPLRKIIFSGICREAMEALLAISYCIADYRPDITEYMFSLCGELESKFGKDDKRCIAASLIASSIEED
jgi:hypothetical protein